MSKATITHIKVGRRAAERENLPNNWQDLDISKLSIPQNHAVFVFGGNTTTRPEAANGNAKIIKALLPPDLAAKTSIYSFVYETEPVRREGFLSKEYEEDARALFEQTFKPMLFDHSGRMKEMKGLEQALSKITFAAHCGGSYFVDIIIDEIYNTLTQKYPPSTAELLVNKIQYFAYAPNEIPSHNVNALMIAPYIDPNFSWAKALSVAESQKVDTDYPKGIIKKLLKAKAQMRFQETFDEEFKSVRAVMFKVGNSTFFIPSRMNPNRSIGDHSIECVAKPQFLHSGTDLEETAQISNFAARLYFGEFIKNSPVDTKRAFNLIAERIESTPTEAEKNVSCL